MAHGFRNRSVPHWDLGYIGNRGSAVLRVGGIAVVRDRWIGFGAVSLYVGGVGNAVIVLEAGVGHGSVGSISGVGTGSVSRWTLTGRRTAVRRSGLARGLPPR